MVQDNKKQLITEMESKISKLQKELLENQSLDFYDIKRKTNGIKFLQGRIKELSK